MTPKQHELFTFIARYIEQYGHAPSYNEMVTAQGLHSKNGIHRMVTELEAQGVIRKRKGHARAIEIVKAGPSPTQDIELKETDTGLILIINREIFTEHGRRIDPGTYSLTRLTKDANPIIIGF